DGLARRLPLGLFEELEDSRGARFDREAALGRTARLLAKEARELSVLDDAHDAIGELLERSLFVEDELLPIAEALAIDDRDDEAVASVVDELVGDSRQLERDERQPARERLAHDRRRAFLARGEDERVGRAKPDLGPRDV